MMAKNERNTSIMTVFLPRENIFFIEEWLDYHLSIGFDHFYLYNNNGSRSLRDGNSLMSTGKNKRGEEIFKLLEQKPDSEIQSDFMAVVKPYIEKGYVTHVLWQPRDKDGNITYAQAQAFMHFVENYSKQSDWVAFTDVDEFIFPQKHIDIRSMIEEVEGNGFTYIVLPQKCFASRFRDADKPVKEVVRVYECADFVTSSFGKKSLIKTDTLRIPWNKSKYNIHEPSVKAWKTKRIEDESLVRFNHYKFNGWELDWIRDHRGIYLKLDQNDDSIVRYYEKVKSVR